MIKLKLTKKEQTVLWWAYTIGFWVVCFFGILTALMGICSPKTGGTAALFVAVDIILAFITHHAIAIIEDAEVIP